MNIQLCEKLISQLASQGVGEFIICAGARNAPFVKVLQAAQGIKVHSFFEERSAGFFALGRIKKTKSPVAVITTSGTAVANLFPAVMEAYHSGLPLVAITADRPKSYRGSGAPQSTEQTNIYGRFASCVDIDASEVQSFEVTKLDPKPIQFNVCFDEPLIDEELKTSSFKVSSTNKIEEVGETLTKDDLQEFISRAQRPLVILSQLAPEQTVGLVEKLDQLSVPVYVEAHANVPSKPFSTLMAGEQTIKMLVKQGMVDSVIRIGGIPTVRFWRDLENLKLPVLNFSAQRFSGLSYITQAPFALRELVKLKPDQISNDCLDAILEVDKAQTDKLITAMNDAPLSEVTLMSQLLDKVADGDQIFIGNSLPIRQFDLVHNLLEKELQVFSQRGLNGIDGLISTGLGVCDEKNTTWIIVGDLSALYDFAGSWAAIRNPNLKFKLVIINNSGGRIFQRVFEDPSFQNRHGLGFSDYAKAWGLTFSTVKSNDELEDLSAQVIEVLPDNAQSKSFWGSI